MILVKNELNSVFEEMLMFPSVLLETDVHDSVPLCVSRLGSVFDFVC